MGKEEKKNRTDWTDRIDRTGEEHQRMRASGGYRRLKSFRVATTIYDGTVAFCERFLDQRSRTVDQMVQAARSGRQNIAEGSRGAATSSQTELRLVGVARASLDELLLDYEDYLRQRRLRQWEKDSPEARRVRGVGQARQENRTDPTDRTDRKEEYAEWLESRDPAVVANALICLIHQANYLLDRQVGELERQFVVDGGYTERLATQRLAERERQRERTDPTDRTDRSEKAKSRAPDCPDCGRPMALRTARKGPNAGRQFWGCSGYPQCKGTRELDGG